jgi:hypothetical protein
MIYPRLAPPDWASLPGGEGKTSAWLTARDRKLAKAAELAPSVFPLAERLEARGALFTCSPDVLTDEPLTAEWYLDLAGMVSKLVSAVRGTWEDHISISPETLAENLKAGRAVSPENLCGFSTWINAELTELYPPAGRTRELALTTVLAIRGARIQGQVQNMAGDDAVLILKVLLTGAVSKRGHSVEVMAGDAWVAYTPELNLLEQNRLRLGGRIGCEFVPGGNRPDLKILLDGIVILVGEVKGRTDLSNLWESWMPQISGHLQTWAAENPQAPRVFFGTIVTEQMIEGVTKGGTRHTGLRAFHRSGLLTSAYNLSNIAEGQAGAERAFDAFVDALCELCELL